MYLVKHPVTGKVKTFVTPAAAYRYAKQVGGVVQRA